MKPEKSQSVVDNSKQQKNDKTEVKDENEEDNVTLDSIIDEFFSFEDQRRRFKNDISMLLELSNSMNVKVDLEHTSSSLSVIVGLMTNQFDFGSSIISQEIIYFEINVNQKYYPQKGTRIYCKTPFFSPCLCDGRDFLQDILGHPWYSQITFVQIVQSIIEFVKELIKYKTDAIYLQKIGKFYIGQNYKYEDIKQFSALNRVPCVQFEDNFFQKLHVRIIGITDAHFLVFDAEDAEKKILKLIFWSDLQSLVEIKRRKDEPTKLSFKWKNFNKQNGQPPFYEQTFQITEPEQVIQQILKKIQKFQRIKIWSNSYMNFGNQWDSKKQVIEQLTQKVYKYEEEIKYKFNIENVQKLIDSYNEMIEHYSSVNDYLSDIFLNSLHNLLNRPDVQCLLNYQNEKQIEQKQKEKQSNQEDDIQEEDQAIQNNQDQQQENLNKGEERQQEIASSNSSQKESKENNLKQAENEEIQTEDKQKSSINQHEQEEEEVSQNEKILNQLEQIEQNTQQSDQQYELLENNSNQNYSISTNEQALSESNKNQSIETNQDKLLNIDEKSTQDQLNQQTVNENAEEQNEQIDSEIQENQKQQQKEENV
ncbi:hypothetical protein TTHERM_00472000 (macronuclear) [Tetrahymena thermophila SB210]|uniref:Uncharacterized protein n=1 Tax=Tetrahymena thermophila (strain SB210) TaxID=312017 RepID=I7M6L3_TETTS|nr:hypothetical protein TTHERM_00472000 [Tetrahymena thermophila SB210]EAR85421.2 hypothetical protein TTHERM_00472000 [Tetrahymena thermophila SB210]|eukprot:XP_001033084.2 hypothetical protein TTHERM_00472000 [Tetrahymena thermophila SB210]